jgi:tetratricopeptide (TPR) repeat protein
MLSLSLFLALAFVSMGAGEEQPKLARGSRAEHEIETTAAWKALEEKAYKQATQHAELVIDKFAPVASRLQKQLSETKEIPPVGSVTPEQEKAIHLRGPLNDVGAAYFICGKAAYKLGQNEKAREHFQEAAKLEGARVWDPQGKFFWAVAPIARRSIDDPSASDKAEHELLTGDAWDAFNRQDYRAAIKHADLCISQFQSTAKQLETQLTKRNATFPEGAVTEDEKARIFQNGLLNDVCTSLFIQAQSAEKLGETQLARTAYKSASALPHARCWDPNGWFWNPSSAAADRLRQLK